MRIGDIPSHVIKHMMFADPHIKIIDELSAQLDVLKIVAIALRNKDRLEMWDEDPCVDALDRAVDAIIRVREIAIDAAEEIRSTAPCRN